MNLSAIIESILFVSGEPVAIYRLAKLAGKSEEEIGTALGELAEKLKERGLMLIRKDDRVSLASHPDAAPYVRQIASEEYDRELSRAALETLAIITYKEPVSRSDIDFIRGVNSSFSVRNLMIRGLVERSLNPKDSRQYLYEPSMNLLSFMGVSKVEELPEYSEFRIKLEEYARKMKKEDEI